MGPFSPLSKDSGTYGSQKGFSVVDETEKKITMGKGQITEESEVSRAPALANQG